MASLWHWSHKSRGLVECEKSFKQFGSDDQSLLRITAHYLCSNCDIGQVTFSVVWDVFDHTQAQQTGMDESSSSHVSSMKDPLHEGHSWAQN